MRLPAILFCLLFAIKAHAQLVPDVVIEYGDTNAYYSFGKTAFVVEDPNHEFTIESASKQAPIAFNSDVPNFDFTKSTWWVRFSIKNETLRNQRFWLEVARPLTNVVELHKIKNGGFAGIHPEPTRLVASLGDEMPFEQRIIQHRKYLFPVVLEPGEFSVFWLRLRSDGEVITLPLKLWRPPGFLEADQQEQAILGTYYGILLIVFIIYLFFWLGLRRSSFFYYILYIVSLAFFQFSIDGLAFQYLWPNNTWLGNHAIVISACLAVVAVLQYARTFLKLKKNLPVMDKVFIGFMVLTGLGVILGASSGSIYTISFPYANIISLLGTLTILVTVVIARSKKQKVSPWFMLAFVFLVLGGIVFILGNTSVIPYGLITEQAIKIGSGFEVIFLSIAMAQKFREIQEQKERATATMLEAVQENERIVREQNAMLEQKVRERTAEIRQQKEELALKNKDITDSINYAQRIQSAILPAATELSSSFEDNFILLMPKDIVSGDFYWFCANKVKSVFCAADCTGHGVPGAFMSMIGASLLNEVVNEKHIHQANKILDEVRAGVIRSLRQNTDQTAQKDGMDAALCVVDHTRGILEFAGANNPLYLVRGSDKDLVAPDGTQLEADRTLYHNGKTLHEFKGDKQPVGVYAGGAAPFTSTVIQLESNDRIYVFSDGFADQFGGPKGKKFKYTPFKRLLCENVDLPMAGQAQILKDTITEWMGNLEQIDDICILGVHWQPNS